VDRTARTGTTAQAWAQHVGQACTEMTSVRRVLTLIPAHNEAASLRAVVSDLREQRPGADILVVNDGSSDDTASILSELGVRWLHWPERRGVGSALRAGLRYAARQRYDVVVRLDADGQHDATDIARLLVPLSVGAADVVLGSRFSGSNRSRDPGPIQRSLGALLSLITRRTVTDPTSGFWALGPRAVTLLAEHLPDGYPEPELHLFLSRNAMRVVEVDVQWRARLHGRSSLTAMRLVKAGARVALAMIIVPFRASVGAARD
jgi:glycosyltransferase involved in cell wall biosynthesis